MLLAFALVAPAWRNRGLGTALLLRSGNRLAAKGETEWTLAVTVGNPAQRLYERLGFRVDQSLWLLPRGREAHDATAASEPVPVDQTRRAEE